VSSIPQSTRAAVLERDSYRCVSCRRSIYDIGYSLQHRLPRGMGGSKHNPEINGMANLIVLCGSATTPGGCHLWAETHREKAYEWGYLIRRGTASPAFEPVLTADGWRRFDNDGGITDAYPVNATAEKQRELDAHAERARLERMGVAA
jgi:5-methylcytosine-specific restriction protein A